MARVQLGLETLVSERASLLRGAKVGVLCHPASVDSQLRHILDILPQTGAHITAVFGPEHGARGEAQDMEGVEDMGRDPRLGVPVHSLYGASFESLAPKRETLSGLDALVIDLQDVGARYYTFVWTMALCMKAARDLGLRVLICDRPNPLGGELLEGNVIKEGFSSFVGLYPLPNRHGMTPGEIALLLARHHGLDCALEILPMRGWSRDMFFDDTGLFWVYPSPNMPTLSTALVYVGMCLVEATELSEGRGTCRPFELAGAPGVDPYPLALALSQEGLPGCRFRPLFFRPKFQKHAQETCGGVQIHVTDRRVFDSYKTGVAFLKNMRALSPEIFAWRQKPYEFVDAIPAIDLLAGEAGLREGLEAGASLEDLCRGWQEERQDFEELRREVLLY